jgi:hypothetical protein
MDLLVGEQTCHYTSYCQRGNNNAGRPTPVAVGPSSLGAVACCHLQVAAISWPCSWRNHRTSNSSQVVWQASLLTLVVLRIPKYS